MSNLIKRASCVGLDCAISRVQDQLYNELNNKWAGDWDCFPRIYKNKKIGENGNTYFTPEYLDGTFEYSRDTLFDDKVDVTSFFLEGDKSSVNNLMLTSEVSIIFSCKINKIYPSVEKEDMRMKQDIFKVVERFNDNWELNNVSTSVDEVYKEFRKDEVDFSDISHKWLIRFDFNVNYNFNC